MNFSIANTENLNTDAVPGSDADIDQGEGATVIAARELLLRRSAKKSLIRAYQTGAAFHLMQSAADVALG